MIFRYFVYIRRDIIRAFFGFGKILRIYYLTQTAMIMDDYVSVSLSLSVGKDL